MSNDSLFKTFFVAIAVCVVCATAVTTANVVLRPRIEANKLNFKRGNIALAAGLLKPGYKNSEIETAFKKIDVQVVDLKTGQFVTDKDKFDPAKYDSRLALKNPELTMIPEGAVKPGVQVVPRYETVYIVKNDKGEIERLVLPFFGKGLWSTMYGFVSLEKDFQTIGRLLYYDQLETAGLGGEVENPKWADLWIGKKAYDEAGAPKVHVVKGSVDSSDAGKIYKVDGISGATLTCKGVNNQLTYWLSEYKPLINQLKGGNK